MKRLKLALLVTAAATLAIAAPAAAQMDHSKMPGMNMPMPAKKPAAKKPAVKKATSKKAAKATQPARKKSGPKKAAAKRTPTTKPASAADPHAGHDMSTMPAQQQPPATMPPGHDMSTMPAQQVPQAMPPGHDMSTMPGMAMPPSAQRPGTAAAGTDLPAGDAPPPPLPTDRAADRFFGPAAMEMARHHLEKFHGGQQFFQALANIAEYQFRSGRDGFQWDADAWYGGDINRLWVKSEGEGAFGRSLEKAEVQALYSRAIDPYWNIQGGVRYDFKPNPSRVYATVALEGLAPSFFDIEGALFLSNKGEVMARASAWYDQRITQRLILQPRGELNFAAQNSREIGVGAGLSDAELGLRLRYDIRREFAPYVGVQYSRAFGRTRQYLTNEGEDADNFSLVAGIRFWF